MKQITFRELLELIHEGKPPIQVQFNRKLYRKYGTVDYQNEEDRQLLSSAIGENHTLALMSLGKIITIYEEILDDKEKEYLKAFIKPFKKYVKSITKVDRFGQDRIEIRYKDFEDRNYPHIQSVISLPTFRKNSMYTGMEQEKAYTLEELGL